MLFAGWSAANAGAVPIQQRRGRLAVLGGLAACLIPLVASALLLGPALRAIGLR